MVGHDTFEDWNSSVYPEFRYVQLPEDGIEIQIIRPETPDTHHAVRLTQQDAKRLHAWLERLSRNLHHSGLDLLSIPGIELRIHAEGFDVAIALSDSDLDYRIPLVFLEEAFTNPLGNVITE